MKRQLARVWLCVAATATVAACSSDRSVAAEYASDGGDTTPDCTVTGCPASFHCEWGQCIPDAPPPTPTTPSRSGDLLSGGRFVFTLDVEAKRLIRIDSDSLAVASFTAGLAPMDVAIVQDRELSVLLDAMNLVEVLDHRQDPPHSAAFDTARSLSHVALSPTGEHAIAYYDWDDSRSGARQPEPGNINQVSVLYLGDEASPMADSDARLINVAVGFLPRDVRFAADGSRAVVLAKDTLTPIDLGGVGDVAEARSGIEVDAEAAEILVDATAEQAVVRYPNSARVDVLSLTDPLPPRCFEVAGASPGASASVTDIALDASARLLIMFTDTAGSQLAITTLSAAAAGTCASLTSSVALGTATQLAAEPQGALAVAWAPVLASEELCVIDLAAASVECMRLEKAVAGVAFPGDGEYALLAHLKASGTPAWDPAVEDPDTSVDKSYGVSWVNLRTFAHRLSISDAPFGPFSFVPKMDGVGATFQAVLAPDEPHLLRVSHSPNFDDVWIDLAGQPLAMGYLSTTDRVFVTQEHPWGRVTFIDRSGTDLRHVTGFGLQEE